jgi:hypothetical protein
MLRLMRHAADLLDACDPSHNAEVIANVSSVSSTKAEASQRATAEAVAIGTASAVLRMIAAAMDDEPPAAQQPEDGAP